MDSDFDYWHEANKLEKEAGVEDTIKWLKDNNIKYSETNIWNVIKVGNMNISLVPAKYSKLIKVRFDGKNKWFTYSKIKLLTIIK